MEMMSKIINIFKGSDERLKMIKTRKRNETTVYLSICITSFPWMKTCFLKYWTYSLQRRKRILKMLGYSLLHFIIIWIFKSGTIWHDILDEWNTRCAWRKSSFTLTKEKYRKNWSETQQNFLPGTLYFYK